MPENSAISVKQETPATLQEAVERLHVPSLLQGVEQNKDLMPDVSFVFDKDTEILRFREKNYSLEEVRELAKKDEDFLAVYACCQFENMEGMQKKELQTLERLAEKENVLALMFLGGITLFSTMQEKRKAAGYLKRVIAAKNKPEGFVLSLAYGNLGLAYWWCPESFEGSQEERLVQIFELLVKGARLGNVYILGRLGEFLLYVLSDPKSHEDVFKIGQKLYEWGSFLTDMFSAKRNYYASSRSLTFESDIYKKLVKTIKDSLKIKEWGHVVKRNEVLELSLAFLYLRHDEETKGEEARAIIKKVADNGVLGAARDYLQLNTEEHRRWFEEIFFFSRDGYRVVKKPIDYPVLSMEERVGVSREEQEELLIAQMLEGALEKHGIEGGTTLLKDLVQAFRGANSEIISGRVRKGQAAAKERGVKFGNPNPKGNPHGNPEFTSGDIGRRGVKRIKEDADQRAEELRQLVEEVMADGTTTLKGIADVFNVRGIPTAREGGRWHPSTISDLLKRLGMKG